VRGFVEVQSQKLSMLSANFSLPGVLADQHRPSRIVTRAHEFTDFATDETKARAVTSHPTKDSRQFPTATLQSLLAGVYM
jgi:hypothetical protein